MKHLKTIPDLMKNWRRWLTLTHVKFVNSLQEGLTLTKKLLDYDLSIIGYNNKL